MNKTGAMMSPIDSAEAREGAMELTNPTSGDSSEIAENRILYMKEADPIGTIPLPATPKGLFSSLKGKLTTGSNVFIDKLGERIAFERTGVRLYEALLSKYAGTSNKKALPPLKLLEQFHHEEQLHFYMLCDVMVEIGGDPTAVTPAADVAGVSGMGLVKVITDPRTTFTQSLEVILQAELIDNACWELLIELADNMGMEDLSQQFQRALEEEENHLQHVKEWVTQLNVAGDSSVNFKARH